MALGCGLRSALRNGLPIRGKFARSSCDYVMCRLVKRFCFAPIISWISFSVENLLFPGLRKMSSQSKLKVEKGGFSHILIQRSIYVQAYMSLHFAKLNQRGSSRSICFL